MLRMFHVRIEAWFLTETSIAQPQEEQPALRLVK